LARLLTRGWVPTVPHPSPQRRAVRTVFPARAHLGGRAPQLKTRGPGALPRPGSVIGASAFAAARGRPRWPTTAGLPAGEGPIVWGVLQQLEPLEQALATLETQLVQAGQDLPGLRRG
jgi:hypothetical protein